MENTENGNKKRIDKLMREASRNGLLEMCEEKIEEISEIASANSFDLSKDLFAQLRTLLADTESLWETAELLKEKSEE